MYNNLTTNIFYIVYKILKYIIYIYKIIINEIWWFLRIKKDLTQLLYNH